MKSKEKRKEERVHSAAVVKLKYRLTTGKIDKGFKLIFDGVLKDLSLKEEEVNRYIEKNLEDLQKVCLEEQ